MRRKTIVLIIIGIVIVAYMLPLLWEVLNFRIGFFTICIGTGCSGSGGSQPGSPVPGTTWCDGYELGFLCLSNKKEYCFYSSPFSMDKCLCEAVSNYEGRNIYRKFCPQNNLCYSNSFEYEFGCSEDLEKTCKETEKVFTEPNACSDWWSTAFAHKFVDNPEKCSQSWLYIYISSDGNRKKNIFDGFILKGGLLGEVSSIKGICTILCANCNSSLCNRGNICEYVNYPPNTAQND